MVKERRTAADALALSPQIEDFISKGISSSDSSEKQSPRVEAKSEEQRPVRLIGNTERDSGKEPTDSFRQEVGEVTSEPKPSTVSAEKRESKRTAGFPGADEMQRLLSKATVQKTVRFQPRLIAQMEAWVKRRESTGETPPSFQQIQNEALKFWLEKNGAR